VVEEDDEEDEDEEDKPSQSRDGEDRNVCALHLHAAKRPLILSSAMGAAAAAAVARYAAL
jgi:hypothetical protein